MFGIVRPCRHRMCQHLHTAWMAHLCGLCLTLRDEHGHAARLVTNYDGLLVSVLMEAQAPDRSPHRTAAPCALRGFRRADVLDRSGEGARLAAAVSLVLAAAKTRDHVEDGDGGYRRRPVAATASRLADRWAAAGARTGAGVGFDVGLLTEAVAEQGAREATPGASLLTLTEPTETAVAAAFAHTATLAGRPGNAPALAEAGRHFGRLAHLLDAVEDLDADRAAGAYNPLLATGTDLDGARRRCDDALLGLRLALAEIEFASPDLARALLGRETRDAVDRTFTLAGHHPPGWQRPAYPGAKPPGTPPELPPKPRGPLFCLAGTLTCCTCGLWRHKSSPLHGQRCTNRCVCCDRDCCDCGGCCDCCQVCSCVECCGSAC
ncbi:MAG: DUF5685 family protein [Mycobacteriales bacterium]